MSFEVMLNNTIRTFRLFNVETTGDDATKITFFLPTADVISMSIFITIKMKFFFGIIHFVKEAVKIFSSLNVCNCLGSFESKSVTGFI